RVPRAQRAGGRRIVGLQKRVEPLLGGRGVGVERQRHVGGADDGVGRAPGGAGGGLDARELLGEELHVGAGGEPRVEVRGLPQGGGAAAADPDGRAAGPVRLWVQRHVLQRGRRFC